MTRRTAVRTRRRRAQGRDGTSVCLPGGWGVPGRQGRAPRALSAHLWVLGLLAARGSSRKGRAWGQRGKTAAWALLRTTEPRCPEAGGCTRPAFGRESGATKGCFGTHQGKAVVEGAWEGRPDLPGNRDPRVWPIIPWCLRAVMATT